MSSRLRQQRYCSLGLTISGVTHSGGDQLPHCEDRKQCNREVLAVKNGGLLPTASTSLLAWEGTTLEAELPAPVKPSDACTPDNILRDPEPESLIFLIHRMCLVTGLLLFEAAKFLVICYVTKD